MKLSYLIYALTLIVYAAEHVGLAWSINVVWWMLIVATVVWIIESLVDGAPVVPHIAKRRVITTQ